MNEYHINRFLVNQLSKRKGEELFTTELYQRKYIQVLTYFELRFLATP